MNTRDKNKPRETPTHLRTVYLFSGQGSQKPGMGLDLLSNPLVHETFECASEAFGFNVVDIISKSSQVQLNETRYAQAAIVSLSLALFRIFNSKGHRADALLGFSLGQVSGLYAAGIMSLEDVFAFASFRAEVMAEAAKAHPGAMCALLDADEDRVAKLCEQCAEGEVLVPANYNSPSQIVISGTKAAIARAQSSWISQKGKAILLATEGAFHSPLMQDAATELERYLASCHLCEAQSVLVANNTALPLTSEEAPRLLSEHLTQAVRFSQSLEYLHKRGASTFVELGYGATLKGLVKRNIKGVELYAIEDAKSLDSYLREKSQSYPTAEAEKESYGMGDATSAIRCTGYPTSETERESHPTSETERESHPTSETE